MSSVDVIIPCYRYAHYLHQCVESVLVQHGPEVRVLVLDDASPDETPEVAAELVRKDSRVTYVRHEWNKGHIATYNEGIDWVSSDYYLLLSADDYLLPGALFRAATLLDVSPQVSFVFGNAVEACEDGNCTPVRPFKDASSDGGSRVMQSTEFLAVSGASNIVPTPTAVVRVSVQKECGGYKTDLPHAGDMEMWFRLAAAGDVGFIAADQAVYRRHSMNMSLAYAVGQWLPDIEQRRAVLEQFFSDPGELPDDVNQLRKRAFSALAEDSLRQASGAFNAGDARLSLKLMEYGLALCPQVKHTALWRKLVLKRMMGMALWQAVNAVRTNAG